VSCRRDGASAELGIATIGPVQGAEWPLKRRILAQREVRAEALLQVDNLITMVSNYERSVMGGIRGTGVLSAGSQASTNCANPLFLIRIATPAGAAGRWIATAAERFIAGLDSPT